MPTKVHFINVGQGNMTLLELADGKSFLYDCNVTQENEDAVLEYVANQIGWGTNLAVFICSHRDADHMRGVQTINNYFPIRHIWDSGVTGTTTDTPEYRQYMELRRSVGWTEVKSRKFWDYGNTRLRVMNSKNDDLPDDANTQSIVVKVVHRDSEHDIDHDSVLLTGDTDAVAWKNIKSYYSNSDLKSSLLLGSHHGSLTFFDDPSDEKNYYVEHITAISPAMTIISVGKNPHGHPDRKAVELYEKYSSGSDKGNKVYRTDKQGNVRVTLNDDGGWSLNTHAK